MQEACIENNRFYVSLAKAYFNKFSLYLFLFIAGSAGFSKQVI